MSDAVSDILAKFIEKYPEACERGLISLPRLNVLADVYKMLDDDGYYVTKRFVILEIEDRLTQGMKYELVADFRKVLLLGNVGETISIV